MALTLANGEKIVKEYEYSKSISGKAKKLITLSRIIVTNKRVVEEKTCYAKRNERIVRSEIPLDKARAINSSFKRRGNALWLILSVVAAIIMVLGFAAAMEMEELMPVGVIGLIATIVFVVLFIFLRKSVVTVAIGTDTRQLTRIMNISSATKRRFGVKQIDMRNEVIRVFVNPDVAIHMVDELGAAILDAQNDGIQEADETPTEE